MKHKILLNIMINYHSQILAIYIPQYLKSVSVYFLEKWRHFVSPKTLLCFRVGIIGNTFSVKRVFEQML